MLTPGDFVKTHFVNDTEQFRIQRLLTERVKLDFLRDRDT